jgi:RNA polymerase sigma factor (sigma-70 family)
MHPNEVYLNGIRTGDVSILRSIHAEFFPGILAHIRQNSGSREDAEDVFQNAIVIVFQKLRQEPIELSSSFYTFLFAICKNLWLKALRKKKGLRVSNPGEMELTDDISLTEIMEEQERHTLYRQKFRQLGEDCQRLLKLFFTKTPMAEIARTMGYASEGYAKKRKFICKKQLIELIEADPLFAELKY